MDGTCEMPAVAVLDNDGFQPCEICGCRPVITYIRQYTFETYRAKASCPNLHNGISVGGLIAAHDDVETIRQRLLMRWTKLQKGIRRGKNKRARSQVHGTVKTE